MSSSQRLWHLADRGVHGAVVSVATRAVATRSVAPSPDERKGEEEGAVTGGLLPADGIAADDDEVVP